MRHSPIPKIQAPRGQRGVALVLVLGTLAVLALMAAHLAAISQVTANEAKVSAAQARLAYVAESAAERAFWLLIADRRQFPDRNLGASQVPREDEAGEPWMTDGQPHLMTVDGFSVQVTVVDADSGFDFNRIDPARVLAPLLKSDDLAHNDTIDRFLDVVSDYVDADDTRRLHGKEQPEYEAEDIPDLPRNGLIQFREELCWLDGVADVLPAFQDVTDSMPAQVNLDSVRIIPPPGFLFPRPQRISFFAAPPFVLQQQAKLTAEELDAVLAARQEWVNNDQPPAATLDPVLYQRLSAAFNFNESGVATFRVTALGRDGEIRREWLATRDCRNLNAGNTGGVALVYWERCLP